MKTLAIYLALMTFMPSGFANEDNKDIEAGKTIFESRCSDVCHQTPRADHLSAKQWRVVLKTMQTRMQSVGMTPLTKEEIEQVYQYITSMP
jgi:mono/diheme cytochrome c family protein